jgi:hypothetical protein
VTDPEGRFRSHKHYVEALAWIGERTRFDTDTRALARLAKRFRAQGISDRSPNTLDLEQVHRSLRNAWTTELLLALPGEWTEEDEFIRLANSWGVIQAYYVGYHATQALVVARGDPRPTSHPKTQNLYADLWVDRPLDLGPWSLGIAASGWKNLPPNASIDPTVHPWKSCDPATSWSLATKVLKTTRDDVVKRAIDAKRDEGQRARKRAWEAEEQKRVAAGKKPRVVPQFSRPHLTLAEKDNCDRRTRTHTFLDYLWRLRISSNYDDSAIFTDGPDNDVDSYIVHRRMGYLAAGTSLLAELRISQVVGEKRLRRWADAFIKNSIPDPFTLGLKARRVLL